MLEPLARVDDKGVLVPVLAEAIPTAENGGISEDLTTVTWKLREGLVWSDGTPVTADDVIFTWQYCTHPEGGCSQAPNFDDVANVEAVDPRTVKVTFGVAKPYPYSPFVGLQAPIIQKAQFADCLGARAPECTEANFGPIGTGPFVVTDFKANDVIAYAANPNYRDPEKPAFATVVLKGGGDAASAARAVLETGEFDYAWNAQVEPEILVQMLEAGKGEVIAGFGTNLERLQLNQTDPDPALGAERSTDGACAPVPDRCRRRAGAEPRHRPRDPGRGRLRGGRAGELQPGAGAGDQRLDQQRLVPHAGPRRGEPAARRSRLGDGRRRGARQGRRAAVGALPDLDQLGAPGGAGAGQAVVERDRRRGRAAQHRSGGLSSAATPARPTPSRSSTPTSRCTGSSSTGPIRRSTSATGSAPRSRARRRSGRAATSSRWCSPAFDARMADLAKTAGLEERARIIIELNDMVVDVAGVHPARAPRAGVDEIEPARRRGDESL